MELVKVHPELRRLVRHVPLMPLRRPWFRRLARAAQRRLSPATVAEGARFHDAVADGVAVRVYRPEAGGSGAGMLWIHGGGLVIGHPSQDDRFCSSTARDLGMVVVSVDYRLAPEEPFPAALEDCATVWEWFQRCAADFGVDPARIVVGGQSAGGGLAACLTHRLHDGGGVQPRAQLLMCPMLDDRTAAKTELDEVGHWVWNNGLNRIGWRSYLGGEPGVTAPPYAVAARREDLRGLPPAWIGVGDIDLFSAEDADYARRLRAAGVPCELDVVPGAPHGFTSWGYRTSVAEHFVQRSHAWLARAAAVENA
ncbi:alpha/beta hydrolase [Nocardiopsis sediminis]|uniref:Alpha/beta hydrolase n=1 Tax=Nocardiopsis sediminis TaxID=1778267 RepID=A0ABV8FN53_9ACTN